MTSPTAPMAPPAVPGQPAGAARLSKRYYDETGRMRIAGKQVPIDQYGRLAGVEFGCRRCRSARWFPAGLKGVPVCDGCSRRMVAVPLRGPSLLPWRAVWEASRQHLYPVAALPAMVAAGAVVDTTGIPALALAGLTPVAGVVATRVARRGLLKTAAGRGRVDPDAPESDKRIRAAIARQARAVGYTAAAGTGWLALAAGLGVDPSTAEGAAALLALVGTWLVPAGSWWRKLRLATTRQVQLADEPVEMKPQVDVDEAQVRRTWALVLAAKAGQVVGRDGSGQPVTAPQNGKLPGTILEDWYRLPGGWGATIVGPIGVYESDAYAASIGKIASAFSVRKSMVTVMPDPEDENRAMVMVQRSSPLKGVQRWAGPDSIDVAKGCAPVATYADSTPVLYELFREGWGSPHDFLCGTTGAGKSEALSTLLLVDRWAHYTDDQGVKHGLVADLLIDPQQGQSYEPFMDDLAAPVAVDLDEAKLMVKAVRAEMKRRNRYLSKRGWRDAEGVLHRAEWVDEKGRTRYGRKWWDPRIDGPILTLNIDEAHEFLADKEFATLVTSGARMYRKCGIRIRVVTHTPLLTDLGGSMPLRSMLTGGFVWCGRTADRLSSHTAFNGRLPADPCALPLDPGMGFAMGGLATKPMTSRMMWEPDYLDWIRDGDGEPIGYPAEVPAATWEAFGPDFAKWVEARGNDEEWLPEQPAAGTSADQQGAMRAMDAVLLVLAKTHEPVDMDGLDAELVKHGQQFSTRTLRDVLAKLRKGDPPLLETVGGRHRLTARGVEEALTRAELVNA